MADEGRRAHGVVAGGAPPSPPFAPASVLRGTLRVLECRNLTDAGAALSFCECHVSIVQDVKDTGEQTLGRTYLLGAPGYRRRVKKKRAKQATWKQDSARQVRHGVRACVHACLCVCVRVRVYACVRACVCIDDKIR